MSNCHWIIFHNIDWQPWYWSKTKFSIKAQRHSFDVLKWIIQMIAGSVNSVCSVSNVKVVFQRKREEGIKLMKYFVDTFKLFCWYSLPELRIARSDFCVIRMTLMRLLTPYKPHIMLIALWSGSRFFTFWLKWFCV